MDYYLVRKIVVIKLIGHFLRFVKKHNLKFKSAAQTML